MLFVPLKYLIRHLLYFLTNVVFIYVNINILLLLLHGLIFHKKRTVIPEVAISRLLETKGSSRKALLEMLTKRTLG